MKKLLGMLLLVGFVSAPGFAQDVEEDSPHSWTLSLDTIYGQSTNNYGFDGTVSYGYKLSDDWTLKALVNGSATTSRPDKNSDWEDWQMKHGFLRAELLGPTLFSLGGGWDFKLQWRYYLPTASKDEHYGRFQTRSYISNTFGQFSISVRNYADVWLNRNAYKYGDGSANTLWRYTFGIVPVFTIAEGLTFAWYNFASATMNGEAKGTNTGTTWSYYYGHEFELLYTAASLDDLSMGLFYKNDTTWDENSDFSYKDKASTIGLRLSKSF